jgi:hypothetical protein
VSPATFPRLALASLLIASHLIASVREDSGVFEFPAAIAGAVGQPLDSGAVPTVQAASSDNAGPKLVNISSRSKIGRGSDILISGFVVTGTAPKLLLIRAVGPTLSQFGLSGLLQRPKIKIYSGATLIHESAPGSRIPSIDVARSANLLGGAFALPDWSDDTVVVESFDPGAYTIQVSGEHDGTGVAVVEVYDLDSFNSASRLVNLSTRSMVGRGSEILIPGIFVSGSAPKQILLRAVGPGLRVWGVDNNLARPKISLFKGTKKIAENIGWSSTYNADAIAAVSSRVGAFPLSPDGADSALLVTIAPGAYTLHVSGADGGTGVALAEVYETDQSGSSDGSHSDVTRPRKIYGHYMGCFAAGSGGIQYHATTGIAVMEPPSAVLAEQKNPLRPLLGDWAQTDVGGTYRNFALAPQNRTLSVRESAELEIRRAMRIGLDGFSFDAWAGGKHARDLLDVMFEICETEDLPFELTITLDTSCLNSTDPDLAVYSGNVWEKTIKWLLDKHGDSPKLARRDGKVLIMGYQSIWPGQYAISQHVKRTMPHASSAEQGAEANRLRTSEQGWQMIADAYWQMESNVGQPIYWEFCLNAFFHGVPNVPPNCLKDAAAYLAQYFPALGMFEWTGDVPAIAAGILAQGAEWSHPMKMQYENFGYYQSASPGINWVRGDWKHARTLPSTLIQHITWNDYHEATNLSPGYNSRYAYYDITGEFIRWWKTGKEPASDRDKVYLFSHKYAHDTPMFPFQAKTRADNVIEIVTILREPATLRMPGRVTVDGETEWQAPAGMSSKQFPLTPGPVSVELVRNGVVAIRLDTPEPVSDRPFRQDTGKVAVSTEDQRLWAEDFGADEPYFNYSEYGDEDGDGLPNWFEMFWYGKFGMMNTATGAEPHADPAGTGKTNLQHFLDQTDPFRN